MTQLTSSRIYVGEYPVEKIYLGTEWVYPKSVVEVAPSHFEFPSSGGEIKIEVKSNDEWTII